jgi:hypothetical protein
VTKQALKNETPASPLIEFAFYQQDVGLFHVCALFHLYQKTIPHPARLLKHVSGGNPVAIEEII